MCVFVCVCVCICSSMQTRGPNWANREFQIKRLYAFRIGIVICKCVFSPLLVCGFVVRLDRLSNDVACRHIRTMRPLPLSKISNVLESINLWSHVVVFILHVLTRSHCSMQCQDSLFKRGPDVTSLEAAHRQTLDRVWYLVFTVAVQRCVPNMWRTRSARLTVSNFIAPWPKQHRCEGYFIKISLALRLPTDHAWHLPGPSMSAPDFVPHVHPIGMHVGFCAAAEQRHFLNTKWPGRDGRKASPLLDYVAVEPLHLENAIFSI